MVDRRADDGCNNNNNDNNEIVAEVVTKRVHDF
jgi:hypothetical protein